MTRRVLLHGFLGAPAAWDELRAHAPARDDITPWMPGHGPSPWTPGGDFCAVVDAFAARVLPDAPCLLVGYSLGARVALSLALRHPARVRRLVLVGVSPGLDSAAAREARVASDEALATSLLRDGVEAFVDAWEALPLFATQRALPPLRAASQRAWRTAHEPAGLAWSLRALGTGRQPWWREDFTRSELPVTLVTGALDARYTETARAMAAWRTGVEHVVVEGVGHNVLLEAPEALARAL